MLQIQSIKQFLQAVKIRVDTLSEAERRVAERLAPNFNLFDFFRGDENGISRCLACLLDPKESHGQGNKFLAAFVKHLNFQAGKLPDWLHGLPQKVEVERATDRIENYNRRIDISIEWSDGVVGIENKPWAKDQYRQLGDYADQLKSTAAAMGGGNNWLLIYLSDHEPDKNSLSDEQRDAYQTSGNYLEIDYRMLCMWLDECAKESKALVVRIFIEELAKYIRSSVMGELKEGVEKELVSLIKEEGNFETAFQVCRAFFAAQDCRLNSFLDDLKIELERQTQHRFILKYDRDELFARKSQCGFRILDENPNQYMELGFGFNYKDWQLFYWGIGCVEVVCRDEERRGQIAAEMNASFTPRGKTEGRWAWWIYADNEGFGGIENINNWSESLEPWQAMADGRLVNAIVKIACKVYGEVFKGKESLLL